MRAASLAPWRSTPLDRQTALQEYEERSAFIGELQRAGLVDRLPSAIEDAGLFSRTMSDGIRPALPETRETASQLDIYCVALYEAGLTMAEIGRRLGVSRERVRQRLRRAEERGATVTRRRRWGPHWIDLRAVVALVRRDGSVVSWSDVARRLGRPDSALRRSAAAVGLFAPIDRLLRLRRHSHRWWSRERVLCEVARVARARQRTPSSVELMREHPALFAAMYRFFASYHDVCELAGLPPRRGRNRSGRNRASRRGARAETAQQVPELARGASASPSRSTSSSASGQRPVSSSSARW